MHLTVDGHVYEWQRRGGVSRLFNEVLPRACDLDPSLRVTLFTQRAPLAQVPPTHARIRHLRIPDAEVYLRPRRVWRSQVARARRLFRRACLGRGEGNIWHSTYFTEPDVWKGKRVVTVYDLVHQKFPQLFAQTYDEEHRERMRQCIEHADIVIAISQATGADLQEYYGLDPKRIRVVPLAPSDSFQLRSPEIDANSPAVRSFLLYVGDRNHYKNFKTLLDGYGHWKDRGEIELLVVGNPEWSASEAEQLERLGIRERVRLLGFVDDERLAVLYRQALAFVYPSLHEGFGIPVLEALACGCTVVASRIPSTLEVADEQAIYFDPLDSESLTSALDVAWNDAGNEERRAKRVEHAQQYSWDRTADRTLAVYRELVA